MVVPAASANAYRYRLVLIGAVFDACAGVRPLTDIIAVSAVSRAEAGMLDQG